MSLGGSTGSGSGGTQRVEQTNLPSYYRPYAERMIQRAESASLEPYIPYDGPRVSGLTGDQLAGQQGYRDIQGVYLPYLDQAGGVISDAAASAAPLQQLLATPFGTPQMGDPREVDPMMGVSDVWDASTRDYYMSPFIGGVTDIALRQAQTDLAKALNQAGLRASKYGAFGGSRHGVTEGALANDFMTRMSDIVAKGQQSAYENAQQQYERDRAARLGVQRLNIESDLTGQRSNQQAFLDAASKNLQAKLEAEKLRQSGLLGAADVGKFGLAAGNALAGLGELDQKLGLEGLNALMKSGEVSQGLNQKLLDTAYYDFLAQREYPREQVSYLSNILRGLPQSVNKYVTTQESGPSAMQGLAGLGLMAGSFLKKGGPVKRYGGGGGIKRFFDGEEVQGDIFVGPDTPAGGSYDPPQHMSPWWRYLFDPKFASEENKRLELERRKTIEDKRRSAAGGDPGYEPSLPPFAPPTGDVMPSAGGMGYGGEQGRASLPPVTPPRPVGGGSIAGGGQRPSAQPVDPYKSILDQQLADIINSNTAPKRSFDPALMAAGAGLLSSNKWWEGAARAGQAFAGSKLADEKTEKEDTRERRRDITGLASTMYAQQYREKQDTIVNELRRQQIAASAAGNNQRAQLIQMQIEGIKREMDAQDQAATMLGIPPAQYAAAKSNPTLFRSLLTKSARDGNPDALYGLEDDWVKSFEAQHKPPMTELAKMDPEDRKTFAKEYDAALRAYLEEKRRKLFGKK